ncbi:MAG TPA: response regulator [Vicinamibacterales bacterium]|nr:response regulator [Vicinamibacterales bacterium]
MPVETAHQTAARPGGARRILIVEDSEDLRALMVLLLRAEGYDVDAASSAPEALDWLARRPYDLVLTDYALRGLSGVWLLRQAFDRSLLRGRALIITAHPNPIDTDGFEVIRKPLEFDSFLARIRILLGA